MTDKMLALRVPLVLSRVRWVKAQLVAEIPYRTWTGMVWLLRHTVYI